MFNSFTDIALRRLYKFILKRTIGRYLDDELSIEQVKVISRDGIVTLTNLKLKVEVINQEFLAYSPLKLVSFVISELKVHISYSTLLTDSCKFIIDKVAIVFTTNESCTIDNNHIMNKKATKSTNHTESNYRNDDNIKNTTTINNLEREEDNNLGLNFIAHWIEVIISRLQIHIQQIDILFLTPDCSLDKEEDYSRNNKASTTNKNVSNIHILINELQYFNDNSIKHQNISSSSIALSTSASYFNKEHNNTTTNNTNNTTTNDNTQPNIDIELGLHKLCCIESIECFVVFSIIADVPSQQQSASTSSCNNNSNNTDKINDDTSISILKISKELILKVNIDKNQLSDNIIQGIDIDAKLPSILIQSNIGILKLLIQISNAYSKHLTNGISLQSTTNNANNYNDNTSQTSSNHMKAKVETNNNISVGLNPMLYSILHSDPTLRTLLWLEEQERHYSYSNNSNNNNQSFQYNDISNNNTMKKDIDESAIDYVKITGLMKKVE